MEIGWKVEGWQGFVNLLYQFLAVFVLYVIALLCLKGGGGREESASTLKSL